jgi:hypothetical protein
MRASTCAPFSSSALSGMKLCTIPNSHKLLGITKSAPTTSLCTGTRHVIRGQVNSRDNKGKEEEIQELRTCRICKKLFQPVHNHPQACRYHTAHFGGGSGNSFFLSFFFNGFCFSFFFFWLISLNSPRCHSMYEECQSITIICTLWGFGILLSPQASSSMDSFFIFCLFHVFAHLL